jgi:hypothetical protein
MSDPEDKPVGFKSPPKSTQFQKGRSGNPSGRPKGKMNFATVLMKALHERITVTDRGRSRSITKYEVMSKQLVNKAAAGDLGAIRLLTGLVKMAEDHLGSVAPPHTLADSDRWIMEDLYKRLSNLGTGGDDDNS